MKEKNYQVYLLGLICFMVSVLWGNLYFRSGIRTETPETQKSTGSLEEWTIDTSMINGLPLAEDKTVYNEITEDLYDVYISVFPTKDASGSMITLADFDKHTSRDHTYNPVLNCNIQILGEGERMDPLVNLDSKNATIRVRGNSSRGDLYKSYKVKLTGKDDAFFGQTTLNINKHSEDITKIATKMETALLAEMNDIASYRTYFMRLWIRDASLPKEKQKFEYYGLYTEIEQPNKTYLEARGLSANASMYKARNFNFTLSEKLKNIDDPEYDEAEFETVLTIREGKDHTKLLEMLAAVNDETKSFEEVFHTYFQEDNYLTWLAFNLLMGNNDIINHNFILYNPAYSNTWYFIPWDFDGTLQFGPYESSLMKLPDSLKGGQKLNQSVLHRRYLRMEGSIEKIQAKMEELLDNYITPERIRELTDAYLPVLEKTMTLHPDMLLLEMPPGELPEYLGSLYDGIYHNYEIFKLASQYPVPMYVGQPEKNEDGTIHFAWQPSYSYQGRTITYGLVLYSDYSMKTPVLEKEGLSAPFYDTETPIDPGTYYLKVTATDSAGHEQLSMERYETMITETKGLNVNGLLEVVID